MPEEEWPIKTAKELATNAKEGVNKLQQKKCVASLTRAKARKLDGEQDLNKVLMEQKRPPAGSVIQSLVDVKGFSSLSRLVKTVAWLWRATKRLRRNNKTMKKLQWEAVPLTRIRIRDSWFVVVAFRSTKMIKSVSQFYPMTPGCQLYWPGKPITRITREWLELY